MIASHERDRILAGERVAQAIRLLREVLAMGGEARGGYKPLLDIIHGVERLADGLRDDHETADAAEIPVRLGGDNVFADLGIPDAEECLKESERKAELATGDEVKPDLSRWSDRLVWDANISAVSPIIRGTWVTVSHVVSLIIDGWTWSDVLRTHPELAVEDIRTCLAYTVADANGDT